MILLDTQHNIVAYLNLVQNLSLLQQISAPHTVSGNHKLFFPQMNEQERVKRAYPRPGLNNYVNPT